MSPHQSDWIGAIETTVASVVPRQQADHPAGEISAISPHDAFELTNNDAIEDVLQVCRDVDPELQLAIAGWSRCVRLLERPLVETANVRELAIVGAEALGDAPYRLHFDLYGTAFLLTGELRQRDGCITSCLGWHLYCVDRRIVERVPLPSDAGDFLWTSLDGEQDELHIGRASICDITPYGLGVALESHAALPTSLFAAVVRIGTVAVPCLASVQRAAAGPGQLAGVTVQASHAVRELIELYIQCRYPRIAPRHSVARDVLLDLMVESGYLALRTSLISFDAWWQLRAKDSLSFDHVYRAHDGKVLAHCSVTQIYRHTWLWHQLASLSGHVESSEGRFQLYALCASLPVLHHGDDAHALAYFDQGLRWHQLFFQGFITWVNDTRLATICSFDRFERSGPPERFSFSAPGCVVRGALDADELMHAAALVRAHLAPIVADAFDINPSDLQRPAASERSRGREVLMLYEDGALAGVALCELGDPCLSLFNVFNAGHIYLRRGRHAPSRAAQRSLVAAMRAAYLARGVENPLLIAPADTMDRTVEPGTEWAERMGAIVIAGRGLRQFENFCRFHFSRRWRRHTATARGDRT